MCHSWKRNLSNQLLWQTNKKKTQGPERGTNLSKVTQQWEEWGQEPRSSASFSPPLHGFLERVGFSWQLPGTRRQMGKWVGKIHKEGFRTHEWEILDNLSFFSEVMEMVKRGRIKCSISGKCSPDTHKRYHFPWGFVLSNCFYCTGFEPRANQKSPRALRWAEFTPPRAPAMLLPCQGN